MELFFILRGCFGSERGPPRSGVLAHLQNPKSPPLTARLHGPTTPNTTEYDRARRTNSHRKRYRRAIDCPESRQPPAAGRRSTGPGPGQEHRLRSTGHGAPSPEQRSRAWRVIPSRSGRDRPGLGGDPTPPPYRREWCSPLYLSWLSAEVKRSIWGVCGCQGSGSMVTVRLHGGS